MPRYHFPGHPAFLDIAAAEFGRPEAALAARRDLTLAAVATLCSQAAEGDATAHVHPGAELIFVIEGSMAVLYQDEEHILNAGDSCYFDSAELHSYRGVSETSARALVISAPATLR